jgi:tetratricopeptide (TPR) repeat protein
MRAFASTLVLLATPVLASAAQPPAAASPPTAFARAAVVPTPAVIEKLGEGDRLLLAGDHRQALFAYQDAVHMQPKYAPARVKLGRAYLALKHPPQAIGQAETALALDPENADARKLLDDARGAPAARAQAALAAAPARVAESVPAAAPVPPAVPALEPAASAAHPGSPGTDREAAEEHYRAGVAVLQGREWSKAVAELSAAIAADPKLAVAYAARGSAHFGLGKYRLATDDYLSATLLDANLATPLYGLAECYRIVGDAPRAIEMYERYAASRASDVRDDLRITAARRARELK